jgi:hypothetical protein
MTLIRLRLLLQAELYTTGPHRDRGVGKLHCDTNHKEMSHSEHLKSRMAVTVVSGATE